MTENELYPPTDLPSALAPARAHRRVGMVTVGALAVAAGAAFGVHQATQTPTLTGATAQGAAQPATFLPRFGQSFGGFSDGAGTGSPADGTAPGTTEATAAQQAGIVEIDTMLGYQGAQAAGTGMVLTPTGEILTNNHVIRGATRISVTIAGTGATYPATVVGTDPTGDIAVLRLAGASGLQTANLSTRSAEVGEAVTGVGNAGGAGSLTAAAGSITSVDQAITASDEGTGGNAEQLTGLIQTDAPIQAGDSGGPLYGADGTVIGMDTAASSGTATEGYAIPIATAETVAGQIEAGVDDATIHQGYPAFLGVSLQDGDVGLTVADVVSDGPAAGAGIAAGDVLVSVGGTPVTSTASLGTVMAGHRPGDRVSVAWTTATGVSQSATVTLASGPAD